MLEHVVHSAVTAMTHRGLYDSAAWVTSMIAGATSDLIRLPFDSHCLRHPPRGFTVAGDGVSLVADESFPDHPGALPSIALLNGRAMLAKQEYRRVIHALRNECGDEAVFIRHYAWYMDGERQAALGLDGSAEATTHGGMTTYEGSAAPHEVPLTMRKNPLLPELLRTLTDMVVMTVPQPEEGGSPPVSDTSPLPSQRRQLCFHDDPYLCWLFGVVAMKSSLTELATQALAAAVTMEPLLWCAWHDLASLMRSESQIADLASALKEPCSSFPWAVAAFASTARLALNLVAESADDIAELREMFPDAGFVHQLHATALCVDKDYDGARTAFTKLRSRDPYRIEGIEDFSNVLFVLNDRRALSALALDAFTIDPFRSEANIVAGNMYALLRQHEKSLLHFKRAVAIDPSCVSAWTLMGHEFLELRNTSASVEAYRASIALDERDYRAWYGLGQIYELLQLFQYALHYYSQTTVLRPKDSRMWIAMAGCLERLRRPIDAAGCLERAAQCELPTTSDSFFLSLRRAAQHYAPIHPHRAAACYRRILESSRCKPEDSVEAQLYLASYLARLVVSLVDDTSSEAAPAARAPSYEDEAQEARGSTSRREQPRPSLAARQERALESLREGEAIVDNLVKSLGANIATVDARRVEMNAARRKFEQRFPAAA